MTEAELNGANLTDYGITMTRNADQSIKTIRAPLQNLSKQEVSGLDLQANHTIESKLGLIRLGFQHGLMLDFVREFPWDRFREPYRNKRIT